MARRKLEGLRVLVTGASQGIGRAICVVAAKKGCKVLAAARSQPLLDELAAEIRAAGGTVATVVADVTKPEDRTAMVAAATEHFGGLDVLVNNAGIGATGHFMDSDPEILRSIFETNFFGLTETTRVFLPLLKAGTTPAIVNISSVLGKRALPARCLYSASKFAVAGFSESIRAELAKDGIDVLVVSPGLTQTNFSKNMLEQKAKVQMDHLRGMTSEEVAEATMKAIAKGKCDTTLTFKGKLLVLVNRFFPWIVDIFAKKKVRELFADEIAERNKKRAASFDVAKWFARSDTMAMQIPLVNVQLPHPLIRSSVMGKTPLSLQPSEAVVAKAAANIYAAYIVAGKVPEGQNEARMQRAVRKALWIARHADDIIVSDNETW